MLINRVIPVLLVKDHGLVKTRRFKKPAYVGDPINAIRIFNEKEVDELVLLDITATPENRGPNFDLVEDVAAECFMPLSYGGGIRNLDDARRLFSLGIEKVIIKTSALRDMKIIQEISSVVGSSSVAFSIDITKTRLGRYRVFAPRTTADGDDQWEKYIKRAIEFGAGEIVLNAVHQDGTMEGMDEELIRLASEQTSVPLVAIGGVGQLSHFKAAIDAGADAVGAGSFFVYHGPRRAVLITYPKYWELKELLGQ